MARLFWRFWRVGPAGSARFATPTLGSAMLAWTYLSLSSAAQDGTTDLGGCDPLIMSWINHIFSAWGPAHLDVPMFPLTRRLSGLPQGTRDLQAGRLLAW
ncbi:hypothetical protein PIB30_080810 [Stylosanthes scabra]|uniref:Secreted protein n=1 Tax=Stylosanthes scabra TaxID=79078 RepID=A0ABU6VQ15_9FABA|nr:hypothetical protein [Stylosanthes scabra]